MFVLQRKRRKMSIQVTEPIVPRMKIRNVARKKAITAQEALSIANQQIWQRQFNPDYDQVVLRVSSAPFAGLHNGQPPPIVS